MSIPAYYQCRDMARQLFRLDRCDWPFQDLKVSTLYHALADLRKSLPPAQRARLTEYEAGLYHAAEDCDDGYGVLEQVAPIYRGRVEEEGIDGTTI